MPSPLNIPKSFSTDPERLKSDLERFAQETDRYLRQLNEQVEYIPTLRPLQERTLAFGTIARVNPNDGEQIILRLPRPDTKNIGRRCGVRRGTTLGEVLVYPVDCLVAGAEYYRLASDIQVVEFLFDGDYYPTRAGG